MRPPVSLYPMKNVLLLLAALCAVAVLGVWFALGAHTGWTKTSVAIQKVDPVTEISYAEYENRFVPGVDFLAAGLIGSGLLGAAGLLLSKLQHKKS